MNTQTAEVSYRKQRTTRKPKSPIRVCVYFRVSSEKDKEKNPVSYDDLKAHFEALAIGHPDWVIGRFFVDKGRGLTTRKSRHAFNDMVEVCKRGEYDLILTESISLFPGRLTENVQLARLLKSQTPPVGIVFEKDNFSTLESSAETILEFLQSFAEEEARKKSEVMRRALEMTSRLERGRKPGITVPRQ